MDYRELRICALHVNCRTSFFVVVRLQRPAFRCFKVFHTLPVSRAVALNPINFIDHGCGEQGNNTPNPLHIAAASNI
jgi:hypothetical protein